MELLEMEETTQKPQNFKIDFCPSPRDGYVLQLNHGDTAVLKYPAGDFYGNNERCLWKFQACFRTCVIADQWSTLPFQAPSGRKMSARILDMNIEWSPRCGKDYLALRRLTRNMRRRFCGHRKMTRTMLSRDNLLAVFFRSNGRRTARGFTVLLHA